MDIKYNTNGPVPGYTKYLDLTHRYYIVIPLSKDKEDHLYDCQFRDENGEIKDGYEGFWFDERLYSLMEKYFFNFIDAECDLIITMYEEEYVFPEKIDSVIDIVKRMMNECDNEEVLELAKKLLNLLERAKELNTVVGFCF